MSYAFHILPDSVGTAAQNMAYDFLLLQRYQPADAIRMRHYDWTRPAYTFGLSQSYSYIQSEMPSQGLDVCRRPTGGGLVNHLDDWTYALVIPASHPLSRGQPIETYRIVHQAIANAIEKQGIGVELNAINPENAAPGVCFNKAELYDVVLKGMPSKVAGAAQKRSKNGLLMQGSIWRPVVSALEWNRFYNDVALELATAAEAEIQYVSSPNWQPSEEEALVSQFDDEAWNQRR